MEGAQIPPAGVLIAMRGALIRTGGVRLRAEGALFSTIGALFPAQGKALHLKSPAGRSPPRGATLAGRWGVLGFVHRWSKRKAAGHEGK